MLLERVEADGTLTFLTHISSHKIDACEPIHA